MPRIRSSLFTIPPSSIPNYILYYMDDLLLAAPSIAERDEFFLKVQEALRLYNLQIGDHPYNMEYNWVYSMEGL